MLKLCRLVSAALVGRMGSTDIILKGGPPKDHFYQSLIPVGKAVSEKIS